MVALKDINLKIERGKICAIVGPNGSGKTTLLKILCTLILPDNGSAIINGWDVVKDSINVRKCIGAAFNPPDKGFFPRLSGFSNLEFYAAVNNVPKNKIKERVKEVVDMLGMEGTINRPFQNYSSGFKRRMAIARALIHDPEVIFLDEPFSHLDYETLTTLKDIIKKITYKEKKTIFIATNNPRDVLSFSDKVVVLDKGKVIFDGTPPNISVIFECPKDKLGMQ